MLTTQELQALSTIHDQEDRFIRRTELQETEVATIEGLIKKRLIEPSEDNSRLYLSKKGSTLIVSAKSQLNFSIMLDRMNNQEKTNLFFRLLDKCKEAKIHLNALFKNLPEQDRE